MPAGTNRKVMKIIEEVKPEGAEFDYASVPEFFREKELRYQTHCILTELLLVQKVKKLRI